MVVLAAWLIGAPCVAAMSEAVDLALRPLWEAHNKERARMGLPPLHLDRLLIAAAQEHAQDMVERRTLTQKGPSKGRVNGSDCGKMIGFRDSENNHCSPRPISLILVEFIGVERELVGALRTHRLRQEF